MQITRSGIYDQKFNEGPVWNGLTMYLDAGDFGSYTGAGAKNWTDLVQGVVFTGLGPGMPFNHISGVPCLEFNGTSWWEMKNSEQAKVNLSGDCTLIFWYYHVTPVGTKTILEKQGTTLLSYQQELDVTVYSSTFTYYSRYTPNTWDYGYLLGLNYSGWNQAAIKITDGTTEQPRSGYYSVNGANWVLNYTSRTSSPIVPAGKIVIGSGYGGCLASGYLNSVMIYNRLLSDQEIKLTYNTFKDKFKLN